MQTALLNHSNSIEMESQRPNVLVCPSCADKLLAPPWTGSLANSSDISSTACQRCGFQIDLADGIIDFMVDGHGLPSDPYGASAATRELARPHDHIGREMMKEITALAVKTDWFQAVRHHLKDRHSLMMSMVDTTRLTWLFHCYKESASRTALVLGSRWGTLPAMLSGYYDTVYSVHDEMAELQFQAVRAKSDGLDNLVFMHSAPLRLPLESGSMDLIVLNGQLPYLGLYQPESSPQEAQLAVLKELKRVLSPQGTLYIGGSNRFGAHMLTGTPDPSGLPFISALPRWLASLLYRRSQKARVDEPRIDKFSSNKSSSDRYAADQHQAKGVSSSAKPSAAKPSTTKEYRTYSYSLAGHRKLLKRAGFDKTTSYWCWPNYNLPRMSGPFDGEGLVYLANKQKDHLANSWIRLAITAFLKLPTALIGLGLKLICPTFIMIASDAARDDGPSQALVRNGQHGDGEHGDGQHGVADVTLQRQALARCDDVDSFVRLTLSQDARLRTTYLLLKEQAVSKAVRISIEADKTEADTSGTDSINLTQVVGNSMAPALRLAQPSVKHRFRFDESEGVRGRLFKPTSKRDINAAGYWLGDFQQTTHQGEWPAEALESEIHRVVGATKPVWESATLVQPMDSFVHAYVETTKHKPLAIVKEHGDFTLPNLMFSTDERLEVIDWEHSKHEGHPLMDIGSLCLSFLRRGTDANANAELAPNTAIDWFMGGFSKKYATSGLLPLELAPAYYTLRVIERIITYKPLTDPATYLEMQDTWIPLLTLGLDYFKTTSNIVYPPQISLNGQGS